MPLRGGGGAGQGQRRLWRPAPSGRAGRAARPRPPGAPVSSDQHANRGLTGFHGPLLLPFGGTASSSPSYQHQGPGLPRPCHPLRPGGWTPRHPSFPNLSPRSLPSTPQPHPRAAQAPLLSSVCMDPVSPLTMPPALPPTGARLTLPVLGLIPRPGTPGAGPGSPHCPALGRAVF